MQSAQQISMSLCHSTVANPQSRADGEEAAIVEITQQVVQPVFGESFKQISDQAVESEDHLYLTSNEKGWETTYILMKREPVVHEVILAVSGFFGLNVASMRGEKSQDPSKKLSYLIFIDCNARIQKFWSLMSEVICRAQNEKIGKEDIIQTLKRNAGLFWVEKCGASPGEIAIIYCDNLEREVQAGNSWLSTVERFKTIQRLFQERRFLFKPINLFNRTQMQKLCQSVQALQIKFDTVYLSNIKEYAENEGKLSEFREAVGELRAVVSDQTLFIDTKSRMQGTWGQQEHVQRVTQKFLQSSMEKRFPPSPDDLDQNSEEFKKRLFEKMANSQGVKAVEEFQKQVALLQKFAKDSL